MATIELRLSNKVQKDTGKSEVMLCLRYSGHDLSAKSGITVNPSYFEYYIDRKKAVSPKVPIPKNRNTATIERAAKNGWALRKSGEIVPISASNLETDDVRSHNATVKRMAELKAYILAAFSEAGDTDTLTSGWLKDIVATFHAPGRETAGEAAGRSLFELAEDFICKPRKNGRVLSSKPASDYRLLLRVAARYEGYVRATDRNRRKWSWDVGKVSKRDVEDFFRYLHDEKALLEASPKLAEKLVAEHPYSHIPGRNKPQERGESSLVGLKKKFKALFAYFYEQGLTTNRPCDGVVIGAEAYGDPIYLTLAERDKIASTDLAAGWAKLSHEERKAARASFDTLSVLRDVFVFQCLVGCRVGDLLRLTEDSISGGMLVYTPMKTEGTSGTQARVPLHPKALALIEKYRGADSKGRLFPFVAQSNYNYAIKTIFKLAGITRMVEWRNPRTGENELVPISEVASSHMARRTFIGNLYFKVQDPNLIGKMSGHVDGSRAFARYRKIEDATLRDIINLI